ncbi:MAG: nucleoside triphosphate pyrophosphohydrolase family protein [Gammaproteobacteria bacterium]|nr:nucleoside triphosphate pyrophosphohydrolase family protein [Gammaproteobacteria bacterium]MCY4218479.1 nucleoside triphosphate pyrophosphohydrolase family protein [Gammaproteobacteria bacterium]MCY4275133.1 nucleoside triphosphate pyrophosphohydrolase family protein [Gammaproteobacteria bacterium]
MKNTDSYAQMLQAVQDFHNKHEFEKYVGEDMVYRVALMAEELGEISACVSKGKSIDQLSEECADLLILLLGSAIAAKFDLNEAFWKKMQKLSGRSSKMIKGRIRVSQFEEPYE